MAKPSSVPSWATNTNFAASNQPWASTPTKVQPPSGVQAEGYNPEDPLVAQHENWWKNLAGAWVSFLDPFWDTSDNIVMPANKHITVSGTGKFKHGTRQRQSLPAYSYSQGTLAWTFAATAYLQATTSGQWMMPLTMMSGERITDVQVNAFGDGAADTTYTVAWISASGQTVTNLFQQTDSNRAAAWGTFLLSSLGTFTAHTMADGESLYLFANAVSGNYRWGNVAWIYDHP